MIVKALSEDLLVFVRDGTTEVKLLNVFDEARDILRDLESGRSEGAGWAGRLAGLTRALNLTDGWPSDEYRLRYMPRIRVQVIRGWKGMDQQLRAQQKRQGAVAAVPVV